MSTPLLCFHAMDRDLFSFSPFWNFCLNRRWSVIARYRPQEKVTVLDLTSPRQDSIATGIRNWNRPRTTYMSSITESTPSYFVRNGPELPSSTLLLSTALFSGKCTTSPFGLICSTSSLPFTTYLTDQTLARCVHCLELDKQPIRHSNFLKCRFIFPIFLNAWVCWRIIINIW